MQIIRDFSDSLTIDKPIAIAMGNFDGVHRGHQQLISSCVNASRKQGWSSGVITFEPHPNFVLSRDPNFKLLNTYQEKYVLLDRLGIDYLFLLTFDQALAAMAPEQFVRKFFLQSLQLRKVFIGFDFTFGARGMGTPELLKEIGQENNFEVSILEPVVIDEQVVSSSIIRGKLQDGKIQEAAELLGYFPVMEGPVIDGAKRGRTMGFPTANLAFPAHKLLPAYGVYASWAEIKGQQRPAIINVGIKPTFEGEKPTVEAYIFDYEDDLYAEKLRLTLVQKIRAEKKFPGLKELKEQITIDVEKARQILRDAESTLGHKSFTE